MTKNRLLIRALCLMTVMGGIFVFSAESAHAGWILDLIGGAGEFTKNVFQGIIPGLLYMIQSVLSYALMALSATIDIMIRIPTDATVVASAWGVVRDFCNMFFIVIMIVMAFATIFDIGSFGFGGYDIGSLIGRFLIAALLINFSLVICGILIDVGNNINSVFLVSIDSFSDRLLTAFKPWEAYATNDGGIDSRLKEGQGELILKMFFNIFLLVILVACLLIATVVTIIRIPIVWLLVIFSPLAWLAGVLPATRQLNSKWWQEFIRWNTFLPVFLLIMYFGLSFMNNQDAVLASLAAGVPTGQNPLLNFVGGSIQFLFYQVLIALVLVGGTGMAISGGAFAGAGGIGVAQKMYGGMKGYASQQIGAYSGYTAAKGAIQQRVAQAQQATQARIAAQQSSIGRRIGVQGALGQGVAAQRTAQAEFANDPAKLRQLASSGGREQRVAARQRLQELGLLSKAEAMETYTLLGGNRTEEGRKFMASIDPSKFSNTERQEFLRDVPDIEAKRKVATTMIEKGEFGSAADMAKIAKELFTSKADQDAFLDKGKKKSLLNAVAAKHQLAGGNAAGFQAKLNEEVGKLNQTDILDLDGASMRSAPVQDALVTKFRGNRKGFDKLLEKVTNPDQLTQLNKVAASLGPPPPRPTP